MKISVIFIIFIIFPTFALPQLSITDVDGDSTYVIDFDTTVDGVNNGQFDGSFPHTNPQTGDLDSDAWSFKRTVTLAPDSTYFGGESDGGETSGKFYAYDISNGGVKNNSIGFQPTSTFLTPGSITLQIVNNIGSTATHISVSYNIYEYNTAGYSTYVYFYHSSDNSTYTHESDVDFTSGEIAGSSTWVQSQKAIWLQGLDIPNGSSFYLRWESDDYSGSGSRDEIAIDDISISMGTALDFDDISIPRNFGILSTYPNPFNPCTSINYRLNQLDRVMIKVFSLDGKLIDVLNDTIQPAGDYTINLNGSHYTSGTYVVDLQVGSKHDSKRITLIK